jgi:FkbM family methyltransferase
VRVLVPATLTSVSTYVLLELEDWFEEEIAFLRRALAPGMRVLDIGANYGVYALALARRVGPAGRVTAFEPAAAVAAHVRRSAALNGFAWLAVEQAAVGARAGAGQLHGDVPESRTLLAAAGAAEDVRVITLDDWHAANPAPVDFVKIDVEGAEAEVIAGGRAFFAAQAPLVMLELRAGERADVAPLAALRALGYDAYRHVAGAAALMPLEPDVRDGRAQPDLSLINAFCCKPAAADRLAARGLLAMAPRVDGVVAGAGLALCAAQPAFAPLAEAQRRRGAVPEQPGAERYHTALDLYAASRDGDADRRAGCIVAACAAIDEALAAHAGAPRLLSAVRILAAAGWQDRALKHAITVLDAIGTGTVKLDEPFLAALPRYADLVPAPERIGSWLMAQVVEAVEELRTFATVFSRAGVVGRMTVIAQHGFMTARLERKRQLVRIADLQQATLEPSPLLAESLNAALWMGRATLRR